MLNILDGIDETLQAHTHGYRTRPSQRGQGGTYRNGPKGMSVEWERVETCRNRAKGPCPSKTEIPEIRNSGWHGF
jgi:hypothetical protein